MSVPAVVIVIITALLMPTNTDSARDVPCTASCVLAHLIS